MGNMYTKNFVDAKKAIEELNNAYSQFVVAKTFCTSLNTDTGNRNCLDAIRPKIETINFNLNKIRMSRDNMKESAKFPTPLQKQQLNQIETEFDNCIDKAIIAHKFRDELELFYFQKSGGGSRPAIPATAFANHGGGSRPAIPATAFANQTFADYSEYTSHTKNVLPLIFILALVLLFAYIFVPNRKWKKTALLILAVLEVGFLMYYCRNGLTTI